MDVKQKIEMLRVGSVEDRMFNWNLVPCEAANFPTPIIDGL